MSFPNISHRVFLKTRAKVQVLGQCMSSTWFVRTDGDAEHHILVAMACSDALSPPGNTSLTLIDNVLFLIRNGFVWLLDRQFTSIHPTRQIQLKGWQMRAWTARTCWSLA